MFAAYFDVSCQELVLHCMGSRLSMLERLNKVICVRRSAQVELHSPVQDLVSPLLAFCCVGKLNSSVGLQELNVIVRFCCYCDMLCSMTKHMLEH